MITKTVKGSITHTVQKGQVVAVKPATPPVQKKEKKEQSVDEEKSHNAQSR